MVKQISSNGQGASMGEQLLIGQKEIVEFTRRNWRVIKVLIETKGFPAVKVGGRWESDTELIREWRRKQILGGQDASQ